MRRILLSGVVAVLACGALTSSGLAQPSTPGTVRQVTVAAPLAEAQVLAPPPVGLEPVRGSEPQVARVAPKPAPQAPKQQAPPQDTTVPEQRAEQAPDAPSVTTLSYDGPAQQIVAVTAVKSTDTTATLAVWQRGGPNWWQRVYGPMTAYVGSQGIGQASETTSRTPTGTFGLTESFGIQANNGTRLPFVQVDDQDWWVSDSGSPTYNTRQRCAVGTCPFNEAAGERLQAAGTAYNHAVVIDYNRDPVVSGAGSAFFLHVSTGKPTSGCVSIPADKLDDVMRWLDPAKHPVIMIKALS
ncbi:L,D-transpeptidase family protein [Actinocrispum wychmicini]|uniref:L,D-peptidoglycan transpeptidase YkuD (ErfK/YbiS/YcfS/YnhG family) n=1 Tax=Actinocrispum wychmicini TaxID=1213861 RepID=A0A4R2IUV2_9PSEU|nr:L,D-transpeptidase family protein [Actinocrispum wychmicini]TCO46745.1 L,D-peptidoglycan transpeptidase YkuD (ErfK/YbiS/YcfS/YnhG family) [Actinocrispum wychmicini]